MCHLHFTIHPSKYLLSIYHLPGPSLSIHKVKWRPYFRGVYNAVLKIRPIHHYQFMCHGQSSKAQWLKPPVLGPDSRELGSGPGTPALFLEGGAVIAVIVLGTTRLGWSAVGVVAVRTAWVWGGCGDSWKRSTHQVLPISKQGQVHFVEGIKKGLVENVTFQLSLETWVIMDLRRKTRKGALQAKNTSWTEAK